MVGRVQVFGQPDYISRACLKGEKNRREEDGQNKEEGRERGRRENIISLYLPGFGLLKTMDMSITGSNRRKEMEKVKNGKQAGSAVGVSSQLHGRE